MLCLNQKYHGLVTETCMCTHRPDFNEGAGMSSQVSAALVSRTGKAFQVAATARVLSAQEAINTCRINRGIILKVTDLISLKCMAKAPFLEAYFGQGPCGSGSCGTWVWGGPHSPLRNKLRAPGQVPSLCFSFLEVRISTECLSTSGSDLIPSVYKGHGYRSTAKA